MPQVKQLLSAATAVGAGIAHTLQPELSNRGITIAIDGTGTVSAEVHYQVSNDNGAHWHTRLKWAPLTGTASAVAPVTDSDVDPNGPFPLVRGLIVSISGTGAAVSLGVCAAAKP